MRSVGRMVRGVGLGGLWLSLAGVCRPAVAQVLNSVVRPTSNANASVFTPPTALASGYTVLIRSDWSRPDAISICPLQGGETVTGRLTWTGAAYVGVLRRESKYAECGVHGPTTCSVSFRGSGDVQASGEVTRDEGAPVLYLRWSPARDTEVDVEGSCPVQYRRALERMYRTATHAVLIPLPKAGDGEIALTLEDQPWKVRVSP